jgi:hypothetical protein
VEAGKMTSNTKQNPGCLTSILQLFKGKSREAIPSPTQLPFRVRDNFLSHAELSFYKVLSSVIRDRAVIFTKVRLADIFFVSNPNENLSQFNRISQRHVDFLLCQPDTIKPIVGVELDDASHNRSDRKERDEFVGNVFLAAKLPLVHALVKYAYTAQEIIELVENHISQVPPPGITNEPVQAIKAETPISAIPYCPKCGVKMVLRTASKGEHQGKQFYGCSNYPKCRVTLPVKWDA